MTNTLRPQGFQRTPLPPARDAGATDSAPRTPNDDAAARSEPPIPTAGQGKPKQRDAFFDNVKYLAIVLVAAGHSWEPLLDGSRAAKALYITVYAFHMPAFIMISGYFSRSFDMRPDRLKRLVTSVAVPYLLFEAAYGFFKRWADDDPGHPITLLDPWYLSWFLMTLFVWRLTTPLWKLVRWPVPLALTLAMIASASPGLGGDLDPQRVLQFLPFFVLGLVMKPEHFQMMRRREVRILSVPVVIAAVVFAYWAVPRMAPAWFYHRGSAQELGAPWWSGPVMTLAMFGCAIALSVCFLAWVPRRKMWFTALGSGTLYGYLLHGFLAQGSRYWGWYDPAWLHTPLGAIAVTFIAAGVVTVLCTSPVQRVFRFAIEPKMEWAFKRDATEATRNRVGAAGAPTLSG